MKRSREVKIILTVSLVKEHIQEKFFSLEIIITQDHVLRREMRQFEGAWSSNNSIEAGKVRLERLGISKKLMLKQSLFQILMIK